MRIRTWVSSALIVLLWLAFSACASIPRRQYGVKSVQVEGMEELDEEAVLVCLATRQREKVSFGLSALRSPSCGTPPFRTRRLSVDLFSWPWTEWPVYDEAVLKLDVERVERWYHARGYYGAHVLHVDVEPRAASESPTCEGDDCEVEITFNVSQGEPVHVRAVTLKGAEALPPSLQEELQEALSPLQDDAVFDEAEHAQVKEQLGTLMREQGYARSIVKSEVAINRALLWADVTFAVEPGQVCRIGQVHVSSSSRLPAAPILAATKLRSGQLYRESDLDDAQRSIYALGAFTAVTVRGDLSGTGDRVDIEIELEARRESEKAVGAGLMSGVLASGDELISVPQWDVHLLARYEHRNFFGGLRRFRVEDRPRMIFLGAFPSVPDNSPRFGNKLSVSFSQPGVPEARTLLTSDASWDFGPDPFLLFFRHDVQSSVGLERGFWRQRFHVRVAIHQDIFEVTDRQPIVQDDIPSSYRASFLEQRLILDLRDNMTDTTRGAYVRLGIHEGARLWDPSWNYVRLTPEARGYVPLGLGVVVAGRFALGTLHILDASPQLDGVSAKLGPQAYRLRGGGAQSNRGFSAGQLGDGINGGVRRWESSLELRVPLFANFSIVAFTDMGDVHAEESFRFSHLNTAVGGGLRYRTIIGPLRLDVGYRPQGWQRTDGTVPTDEHYTQIGGKRFDGAIHLTIGESF